MASVVISASAAEVFDLIHDYDRRLEWDPFLRSAELLHGARKPGIGVSTYCAARAKSGGVGMETIYISFKRPDVAAVEMTQGPWILRSLLRQYSRSPWRTAVSST